MLWFYVLILIFTFLLNKLTIKYGFKGIEYYRKISKTNVEIGEEFKITMIVENRKPLPVTFLKVTEHFPDSFQYKFKANPIQTSGYLYHDTNMFLMPYQRIKRTYTMMGRERGVHILRNASLSVGDFLGSNTEYREIEYLQELVVLPKSLNIAESLVAYGDYNGDISVKRWIIDDPLMTIGIREYTGREPQKYIHWNSSLRYGKLMVKNFDFTTDNNVMLILNIESSKPFWADINKESIEESISLSRGVIEEFEKEKVPYGFVTNSQINGFNYGESLIYPGIGTTHLDYILETLGRVSYNIHYSFEELIEKQMRKNEKHTTYIVITPKVLSSYIEPVKRLNKMTNRLVLISLDCENLDLLDDSIIKYVREKQ